MRSAALRLALALAALVILTSCVATRERTPLIHRAHTFDPLPGRMPMLFVKIIPIPYADYMLVVNTPDGGTAYLTVGSAVVSAYAEAFGSYFDVDTKRAKYSDYVALVDLEKIALTIEPAGERIGSFAPSRITLRHEIPIETLRGYPMETLVVEGSAEATLDTADYRAYMRGVAMAVEEILYNAEPDIAEHFRQVGREGKYRLR